MGARHLVRRPPYADAAGRGARFEPSGRPPASGRAAESAGVGALCGLPERLHASHLCTSSAYCGARARERGRPADFGHDPGQEPFALLRGRLCAARESNPQPAGWESRDPSASTSCISAGQQRCALISIMSGDDQCCVVSKCKRRPKRRLDHSPSTVVEGRGLSARPSCLTTSGIWSLG